MKNAFGADFSSLGGANDSHSSDVLFSETADAAVPASVCCVRQEECADQVGVVCAAVCVCV